MRPEVQERLEVALLRLWAEYGEHVAAVGHFTIALADEKTLRLELAIDPMTRLSSGSEKDIVRALVATHPMVAKEIQSAIRNRLGGTTGLLRGMSTIYKTAANLKAAGLIEQNRGDGYSPTPKLIEAAMRGWDKSREAKSDEPAEAEEVPRPRLASVG